MAEFIVNGRQTPTVVGLILTRGHFWRGNGFCFAVIEL